MKAWRKFDVDFDAVEVERRRVAKDLHDEILPTLARLVRAVQSENDEQNKEAIDEMHAAVDAFRELLGELHPVDLEELGLPAALSNVCRRYARFTGRCILFVEGSEDCRLTELQQLCVYRAVQVVLAMFAASDNDVLLVAFDHADDVTSISMRCVDRRVSSAGWVSIDKQEFNEFQSWCAIAGAQVEFGAANSGGEFPVDLAISIRESDPASADIYPLIARREEESSDYLVVEAERQRILATLEHLIVPRLNKICGLASDPNHEFLRIGVQAIEAECKAIMCGNVHPQWVAQVGLLRSIRTLVDRFVKATLIDVTVLSDVAAEELAIPFEAKLAMYRVIQEALNNIEKHSGATQARVTIEHCGNAVVISIEDNGKGFQARQGTQSRGLRNIRERALAVGAEVHWRKAVSFDHGTLVTILLGCTLGDA